MLQLEDPRGLITFGLRREALEDRLAEPDEVLAGIEAVTAEDIQRLGQRLMAGNGLHLALVGPFDDEDRFLAALGNGG